MLAQEPRATPILSPCHGIFTDWFTFRLIFPAKMQICSSTRFCDVTLGTLKGGREKSRPKGGAIKKNGVKGGVTKLI